MKPFLVVSDGMDKDVFSKLSSMKEFDVHPQSKITQDELKSLLPKVEGLIIRSETKITKDLLDQAPNLKYIIRAGEGTDNIDKASCEARGIKVSNTPGANNNSAAEHAIALLMTVLRKTAWANSNMTNGGWDKSRYTGNELTGKKVGIIGFGRIGQIVAKRLEGFEPQIIFYDPFIESSNLSYVEKEKDIKVIFSTCDIITIHIPLMEENRGLINSELLSSMQSHAILINASRGGIVDETALYNILSQKKIKGAGFDVYATEPLPKESNLRQLENLVLTPHLGASTQEAQLRVGNMAVNQMNEFFNNNNLLNEVKA